VSLVDHAENATCLLLAVLLEEMGRILSLHGHWTVQAFCGRLS